MPIIPSGAPPWVRTNDLTHYGGHVEKHNYLSRGVIDALTDVGAEAFSRMAADMAALMRVAPFCTITLLCNDTVPAAPTIQMVHMQTGTRVISYAGDAPPTGFPSANRFATGDVGISFASSYTDPYGVAGVFSISHAVATLISSTLGAAGVTSLTPTLLRVKVFNTAGGNISDPRISVSVW